MRRRNFIAAIGGGATLASPFAALAQQRALPVVGYLASSGRIGNQLFSAVDPAADAFGRGLREQGFVDGRNVEILYRYAENENDRLPALAADLVRRQVAVIVTPNGATSVMAARSATAIIPIVFVVAADPVELGLVASLNRPGGNVTGVSFLGQALTAKRLELVHEIAPSVTSIGFLVNPTIADVPALLREAESAARILGVRLVILRTSTPREIETAFTMLEGQRIGALITGTDSLFATEGDLLVALAARYAVPVIYPFRQFAEAGGLMSYGPSIADAWFLAGTYVGRILKGERPTDLPVQQSARLEMVLNLKTAKALGIEVPTATLLRATEVIE